MRTFKHVYTFFYLLVLFAFSSCSAAISLKAQDDTSVKADFTADTGAYLSQSMQGVIKEETLQRAFVGSDFTNVKATVPNSQTVILSGTIVPQTKQKNSFNGIKTSSFVTCTNSSLNVTLSPKSMKALYSSMSQDDRSYLDLFMAPVFTGEKMTVSEYYSLIASVYGNELAKEMEKGSIKVSMEVPSGKKIKNARLDVGNSSSAKQTSSKVTFNIPLLEFLTMDAEKSFTISW